MVLLWLAKDQSDNFAEYANGIAALRQIVADVKGGKEQAAAGLIGQAKKKNPNANPGKVRQMCLDLIKAM